jgi:hypothetical protein
LGGGLFADRIGVVARDFAKDPLVGKIVAFIRAGGKRPLMAARGQHDGDEDGGDAA